MVAYHLTLTGSLGPMFTGVVLASCLYGVTTLQTYIYFVHDFADGKFLKYLVFFLWVLGTLRLALVSDAAYTYMVTDFDNLFAILKPLWSIFPSAVIVVGLNNAVVRGVWRLSGQNWWLASAIGGMVLATLGSNMAFAVIAHTLATWFDLQGYSWLMSLTFACSMTADVLISSSLCILLAMRKTGYAKSDGIVKTLTMYSINTGLISTLCAALCLITYLKMPDNFVFMALYLVYPELLHNALLATYNSRPSLQRRMLNVAAMQYPAAESAAQPSRHNRHSLAQVRRAGDSQAIERSC
ncbi:hypothetical protein C8Q77DRAFT_76326 [Trametes polyzona]|nr:hypothetical protein C8Q77DRAFT_76326 [Trametes polyzona]